MLSAKAHIPPTNCTPRMSRNNTAVLGKKGVLAYEKLPDAFHETRVQLLRSHDAMRQLMLRCEAMGTAMERCAEAVAALPGSGNSSFANASTASSAASDGSAAGSAAATSHRQLYWSLAQFHTHVAQLLSAASLRAYDAAVADKIANRLSLMERGAETFHQSVVAAQRQAAGTGTGAEAGAAAAAVQGSARQLEQLACTRFAPAYEGFLLYTVATLGDLCALWDTAAQRSAEAVVWSSGQEAQSPGVVAALHAEHNSSSGGGGGSTADTTATRRRRPSATTLSAAFATAVRAAEELRDALFTYVRLLHGTVHQFAVASLTLSDTLRDFLPAGDSAGLTKSVMHVQKLEAALADSAVRWRTRRTCYETLLQERVSAPLNQLHEESRGGLHLSSLLRPTRRSGESGQPKTGAWKRATNFLRGRRSHHSSAPSSLSDVSTGSAVSSMAVLCEAWMQLSETCLRVATEASDDFAKEVQA